MKVYIASNNAHKIAEIAAILPEFEVLAAREICADFAPAETGATFAENALIKARALAAAAPEALVIADDSGLCVDALNGAPGVFSARFAASLGAGAVGDDAANKAALAAALRAQNLEHSPAHFTCAIAAVKGARELVVQGDMHGRVSARERGSGGFGYDAMFFANAGGGLSNAELSSEQKNAISHRAAALAELKRKLAGFLGS